MKRKPGNRQLSPRGRRKKEHAEGPKETVQEFLDRGGKVTVIEPPTDMEILGRPQMIRPNQRKAKKGRGSW